MGKMGRPRHPDILTPREWEVLALLRERLTNEEIAQRLGISLDGAKYHVSSILSKLGASTREEAAAWLPTEVRPWWKRLVAASPAILGAATFAGATAGLAMLAWGVVVTSGPAQEMAKPTSTPGEESIEGTPEEISAIKTVLESMSGRPCWHSDASTAKATLTTTDEVSRLLRERTWGEVFGPSETVPPMVGLPNEIVRDSTHAPVWLVEMKAVQYPSYKHGDPYDCGTESETVSVFTVLADGLLPDGLMSGAQFEITCILAAATAPACRGTTD
jgi:DNA-binding CsgD family transcriptional regulator